MKTRYALLIVILIFPAAKLSATDLSQQTINAWDDYIQQIASRMQQRSDGNTNFLWTDAAPGRREQVHQGEILVEPANGDSPKKVPEGLIHDWIGAAFIPNTSIDAVFRVLDDYDRYTQFYDPAVIRAKLLSDAGATRKFSLLLAEKAPFVTAAISSEYVSQKIRLSQHRWYTISYSTRIQQIDNYGKAGEHPLPPDKGAGYVWRLYSIEKFEERDGGVYTELEAIALSRDIPFELQWLVKPILRHLPRNSMVATLQKTRNAVCADGNSKSPEVAKLGRPARNNEAARATASDQREMQPASTAKSLRPQAYQ